MIKASFLTFLALLAFAGNSILCRLALGNEAIDAASFTAIRLSAGAVFLLLIVLLKTPKTAILSHGSWPASLCLFLYAATFSLAYLSLDTGLGALILFAFVQITLIIASIVKGNNLVFKEWAGFAIALLGLTILLLPGASTPSLSGFVLMLIAGVSWGGYTLCGKDSTTPLFDTTGNFIKALPMAAIMLLIFIEETALSNTGIVLAIVSGAVTSGLGYAIWYAALREITVTQAAIFQLTVPIIATVAGIMFANESITTGFIVSALLILGGIFIFVSTPKKSK